MTVALLVPIKLNGDRAIVGDPCYYNGSEDSQHEVVIQQDGEWKMEALREDFGFMGVRIGELSVVHSTWDSHRDEKSQRFSVGVDSGQMSICGNLDAVKFENPDDYGPNGFDPPGHSGIFDYQGAADVTLNNSDKAGVLCGVMALSESGCGDGYYPVYIWRNYDGFATKIAVDFRDEEDDELEEEEEES